jgi:hypothetical protein
MESKQFNEVRDMIGEKVKELLKDLHTEATAQ